MTTKITTEQITHNGTDLDTVLEASGFLPIDHTVTYDPASIAPGAAVLTTYAVPGILIGDWILSSFSQDLAGCLLTAYVHAAGNVTVSLFNPTVSSVNLASGTLRLRFTRSV